jgi:hypothetical protein
VRNKGLAWGAAIAAVLGVTTAQAAPKGAVPPPASGAAGGAAAAASSSAPAAGESPPALPGNAPDGSAPTAPAAPADATAPAAPETTAPPEVKPDAETVDDQAAEEDDAEEALRKKRKRRRQRALDIEESETEDESPAPDRTAPATQTWRLVAPHFMLSAERLTNLLAWSVTHTATVPSSSFNGSSTTQIELERSGTDVSFLGSGGVSSNAFGVPRVAFDGMFESGFTLGGSLSYLVTSGKHETADGTNKSSQDDPSSSIFVLAPRIGVMIEASPTVGIWLRAGISRISMSSEISVINLDNGDVQTSTSTETTTLIDLTLDPQLVITPLPHVGLTVGALLDIGVGGSVETSGSTNTTDIKESSYGVSGGLVAIF